MSRCKSVPVPAGVIRDSSALGFAPQGTFSLSTAVTVSIYAGIKAVLISNKYGTWGTTKLP